MHSASDSAAGGSQTSNKLNDVGSHVGERAQQLVDKAGQTIEQAEHKLAESAMRGRDVVQEKLRRARDVSRDFAEENPMALAFGTLVAGIGVGLLLPATRRDARMN
jgi:ElaB/YqjD/DUF883 family membrane-anchored ribosome-binding protein